MRTLILRLDAPLLSFGGVKVDKHGFTDRFPGTATLTGLLANSMGWDHGDFGKLQALQSRVEFAARWDVIPEVLVDYHTVDLGQPKMTGYHGAGPGPAGGWTTRGSVEWRTGGPGKTGTEQRYRHHWADGLLTVALGLTGEGEPTVDDLSEALRFPARPLFLGRKACLPARPLLDPVTPLVDATDVLAALESVDIWPSRGRKRCEGPLEACWPAGIADDRASRVHQVYDLFDWANQLHTGCRRRAEGLIRGAGT